MSGGRFVVVRLRQIAQQAVAPMFGCTGMYAELYTLVGITQLNVKITRADAARESEVLLRGMAALAQLEFGRFVCRRKKAHMGR